MGLFSDDGQWWWDGKAWIPTAQVALPQLPPTALEQSGRAAAARDRLGRYGILYAANDIGVALWTFIPLYLRGQPAMRDYRIWTLEQLALATAYLVGPQEAMVAGETTLEPPEYLSDTWKRDLAVAVTTAHVLVFRFESFVGQPRWVALAARATDVTIEKRPLLTAMRHGPALTVAGGNSQWVIRGSFGVYQPDPVIEAWRRAASRNGGIS